MSHVFGQSFVAKSQSQVLHSEFDVYIPERDSALLQATIEEIRSLVQKKRILMKPIFLDFDPLRSGYITKEQFARCLSTLKLVRQEQTHNLRVLQQFFQSPSDSTKTDYRSFLQTVEIEPIASAPVDEQKQTLSKSIPLASSSRLLTLDLLLKKLQTFCLEKRFVADDVFADFDQLRKGTITSSQMIRCLSVLQFPIDAEERQLLLETYQDPEDPSKCRYRLFLAALQEAFTPTTATVPSPNPALSSSSTIKIELEKNPTFQPSSFEPLKATSAALFSSSQQQQALMTKLAFLVYTHRMLLKPAFFQHDRHNCGCITASQFQSVLSSLFAKKHHFQPEELKLLCVSFQDSNSNINVRYADFLRQIDSLQRDYESLQREQLEQQQPVHQSLPPKTQFILTSQLPVPEADPSKSEEEQQHERYLAEVSGILASLQEHLNQKRSASFCIDEVFTDFDPLKKGRISSSQFVRALSSVKIHLSPQDLQRLLAFYSTPQQDGLIEYSRFLQDINPIPKFESPKMPY